MLGVREFFVVCGANFATPVRETISRDDITITCLCRCTAVESETKVFEDPIKRKLCGNKGSQSDM